jgi:hypothetical protein
VSNADRLANVVWDLPAKNVCVREYRSGRWLAKA